LLDHARNVSIVTSVSTGFGVDNDLDLRLVDWS
jgi:hypothetical protein